ncbi:hypothetical protein XENTR_v10011444 [Xenopus tropicalis]|nr:hypothetical protein XENTR_v10011444 [Xenopus tropicalis]
MNLSLIHTYLSICFLQGFLVCKIYGLSGTSAFACYLGSYFLFGRYKCMAHFIMSSFFSSLYLLFTDWALIWKI